MGTANHVSLITSHFSHEKLRPAHFREVPLLRFFVFPGNTNGRGAVVEGCLEREILPEEPSLPVSREHIFLQCPLNIHRVPNLRRFDRQHEQPSIRIKNSLGLGPMLVSSINQEVDLDRPFLDRVVMILTCMLLC
jgi:hypothetical protein